MYIFSILIIVASNILYNVCQKATSPKVNPFIALFITYLLAALMAITAYQFNKADRSFFQAVKELNWTTFGLSFAIVGLEFGYLMAYRAGWNISIGSLVANIFLAIMLIPIGILFFKEGFELNKIFGAVFCIIGLILINKK